MGKDKAKPAPTPEPAPAPAAGKPPKGHRQRGAGTVITAKPAVVTGDGIVLKAHERLPSQLLHEYCQGLKRPTPSYYPNPPGNRFRAVLRDGKNDKNDLTFATPQAFETSSMARDFAALLALFHVQRNLPLERRLPEPYASTWLSMIATEKEQAKAESKPSKGGASAGTTAPAAVSAAALSSVSAKKETQESSAAAVEGALSVPKTTGKAAAAGATVVVLNRDTADWLCDSCGNQNFAKLASGVQRVRCFKCQSPKTDTCQLVASTASATAATSTYNSCGSNTNTSTSTGAAPGVKFVVLRSQAAAAPVDLLSGSTSSNPASRAEEERALQERRAASRRKQLYFDALRRANRPHIVHIPAGLRAKLESLLGISNNSGGGGGGAEDEDAVTLEDVLQTYRESGVFAPDMCNISIAQQAGILERVSGKLKQEGFAEPHVASSMHEVLLQSANDVLEDALDATDSTDSSSTSTSSPALVMASFEKLLTEALLKHLCMNVDEAHLPEAHNPQRFQNSKKLSVVPRSSNSTAVTTEDSARHATGAPAVVAGGSAVEKAPAATQQQQKSDEGSHAAALTDAVGTEVLAASGASAADCLAAVDSTRALFSDAQAGQCVVMQALVSLILLHDASTFRSKQKASAAMASLRELCAGGQSVLVDHSLFLEELEAMQAIFDGTQSLSHRLVEGDVGAYHELTLRLSVEHLKPQKQGRGKGPAAGSGGAFGNASELILRIIVHGMAAYPTHAPLIFVTAEGAASSTSLAAKLRQLQHKLRVKAEELLGEGMIFQVHSFLQQCIDDSAADLSDCAEICAFRDSLPPVRAYLSGEEVPVLPAVKSGEAPKAAIVKQANDSIAEKGISVATTRESDTNSMDTRSITTAISSSTTASASTGTRNRQQSNRKGPGLQSFWTPLPTATVNTPAKASPGPQAAAMSEARRALPAYAKREEVLHLLQTHRAVVVTGETGCGKTTQVPQYLYEQHCQQKILICQPRRLAAVGVATRVAEEVGCALGEQVGYMVKGDSQISQHTRIAFCTYGVMLRRLQQDPTLQAVSTVVLDEVHERGIDSDFTLALLMFALAKRSDLKLILMSATISTEHFASYLRKWLKVDTVPVMFIPGFTFPVKEFYKADYEQVVRDFKDFTPTARQQDFDSDDYEGESPYAYQIGGRPRKGDIDYDLLTKLVMVLARGALREAEVGAELAGMFAQAHGSILVFMPGVPEIGRLSRYLEAHYKTHSSSGTPTPRLKIIPLHGNLSPAEQRVVFKDANKNEVKIVIATNVAEASVTIPDVTVVIDTCRVKEISFDAEIQTSALMMKFAAQDSLRQRRGRAGRVQKGRCFRLITRGTYDKLPEHSVPEILRVPLEKVVLQVKAMLSSAKSPAPAPEPTPAAAGPGKKGEAAPDARGKNSSMVLLCRCPDMPTEAAVQAAEQLLVQIQALSAATGLLTPLGRHLSSLPCLPRVGKLCIYGALMGCVYHATAVAACMTVRSPFISSVDPDVQRKVKAARDQFSGGAALRSDYSALVNIMREFDTSRNKRRFCQDNGLAFERMNELKETQGDLLAGLVELGLLGAVREGQDIECKSANRNAGKSRLVTATLCAGLYPQLAKILRPTKRFVEVSGGTFERDSLAKELKFYIPKNLASPLVGTGGAGANPSGAVTASTGVATSAGTAARPVDKRNVDISTEDVFRVFLHPSSCNFDNFSFKESNFVMYGERQLVTYPTSNSNNGGGGGTDSKVFLRDTTEAPAFALMFFGGELQADYAEGTVTVDGWIRFTAPGRIVAVLQELRKAFDALLQRKFEEPDLDIAGQPVVELTCQLLDVNAQY